MLELRWINIASTTKVTFTIAAICAVPLSVIVFIVGSIFFGYLAGLGFLVMTMALLPLIAVVVMDFGIAVYNIVSHLLGGAGLEIRNGGLRHVDLSSYLRIAVPVNLVYLAFFFLVMFYISHTSGLHGLAELLYPLLTAAAIGSLNGLVDPVVYNRIVGRLGCIKFRLEKGMLRSIDVKSTAKIAAIIIAFNYVFYTFIVTVLLLIGVTIPGVKQVSILALGPYLSFLIYAIIYLIVGFVASAIVLELYNMVVRKGGPVKLDLMRTK